MIKLIDGGQLLVQSFAWPPLFDEPLIRYFDLVIWIRRNFVNLPRNRIASFKSAEISSSMVGSLANAPGDFISPEKNRGTRVEGEGGISLRSDADKRIVAGD